jgi:hypothetical protein
LLVVAFFPFLSAILVLILGHNPALERGVVPDAACPRHAGDLAVQLIMLTGSGLAFCAGGKVKSMAESGQSQSAGRLWWKFARLSAGGCRIRTWSPSSRKLEWARPGSLISDGR